MDPSPSSIAEAESSPRRRVPAEVIWLGVVSFLTDASSEMIFAVLPAFFKGVLKGTPQLLGVMEGLADFAASSLDLASGYISDRTGVRKWLAMVGYGLSTVAKVFLTVVTMAGQVVAFRIVDRLGKSIRGAPRDALLASIAPKKSRGLSFGVHKAMDKAGAILGPLIAAALLFHYQPTAETFRMLFVVAMVPAILSIVVFGVFVRERPAVPERRRLGLRETLASFTPTFRHYMASMSIFSLGYFSYFLLLLRAGQLGFSDAQVALLYALFNAVFTVVSIPIGWLGDRIGRRAIVALSYFVYGGTMLGFLLFDSKAAVIGLFALYGLFFAIDEGQTRAYLTDLSDPSHRATAIGICGFFSGLIYLPASLIAGALWAIGPETGPRAAFGFAAATSVIALIYFLAIGPKRVAPPH